MNTISNTTPTALSNPSLLNNMPLNEFKQSLFDEILNSYYFHKDILIEWRNEMFPIGAVVKKNTEVIDHDTWGIVTKGTDYDPPDQISIQFEDGYVRRRMIREYTIITDKSQWPEYLKKRQTLQTLL